MKRIEDLNYKIALMFGEIANRYDLLNHLLSFGVDFYWRKELVKAVVFKKTFTILDLATGTFDVCKELYKHYPYAKVIGIDLSLKMMLAGKGKIVDKPFLPVCGDARAIPLKDESVDGVTIAFGIRNVYPREEAYKEILRVLIKGGFFYVLEFGSVKRPILGGIYNFYLSYLLPKIASILSKKEAYNYLAKSISEFPTSEEFKEELLRAGFKNAYYKPLSFGIVYLYIAQKS